MDKVKINNQVVHMRKFVKQAKTRAINRYVKEIKLLQNRRGSEDETAKHKRKAERLLLKVSILKKIQPDSISRMALSKEKDWKAVLAEKNVPLENQCYAMLANFEPVQKEVEKFHKTYWDLVPKIAMLVKDWEEKSKDPITKQQKKKARQIRKSMQNIKKENNANTTALGSKSKDSNDKKIKNTSDNKIELNSQVKETNFSEAEHISDNEDMQIALRSQVKRISADEAENISNDEENEGKKIRSKNIPSKKIILNSQVKEISSDEMEDFSDDEENEDKQVGSKSIPNRKSALKSQIQKANLSETHDSNEHLSNEERNSDIVDRNEDQEWESESNSETNVSEIDSDAGNSDPEEREFINERSHDSNLCETEAISRISKKCKMGRNVIVKNPQLASEVACEPQGIQLRLKAIADNNTKTVIKDKLNPNLPSPNSKINAAKRSESNNSLKAIAMLNLNELQDLDEIPIEKASDTKEIIEQSSKRKKDPFFLGEGGEVVSESDNEDTDNAEQEIGYPDFKKKKYNSFDRKQSNEGFFQKRNSQGDSSWNPKSDFREKDFQRNNRSLNFEDKRNNFKNKGNQNFEFNKDKRFKSTEKDQFRKKGETKSFFKQSSTGQFKQNIHQGANPKNHFQKNVLSNSLKKSKIDEKPLHPSWEAKKKLKESAKTKFQGKRIVFAD